MPQGRTGSRSRTVIERTQDQRLKGADLYVARLGWKTEPALSKTTAKSEIQANSSSTIPSSNDTVVSSKLSFAQPAKPIITTSTGSLHDELTISKVITSPIPMKKGNTECVSDPLATVSTSRPCYRCISYMHSVGIKRVFWTNAKGEWDGGKVRDLVDALELSGSSCDTKDGDASALKEGAAGQGVFVTKHEVLMLRRLMGA